MLQSIRDHTQGWIAGIIISLLILSFALWGISSYIGGGNANVVVAKVNNVEITKDQLYIATERLRRQIQIQDANAFATTAANADLSRKALQSLINIQVLKQASFAQGYRVSSPQVDRLLESMPEFQTDGRFSPARFQQLLATSFFNARDFLNLIQSSLIIDQPRLGLIFSSFALDNETSQNMSLVGQERSFQYVVLPFSILHDTVPTISQEAIRTFYKANENNYRTPAQVSVEYIELTANKLGQDVIYTDSDLKNYYTDNAAVFVDKDSKTSPSFENNKEKVKTAYLHQKAMEKMALMKEKLANITYEHPDSLAPAAKALGLTIQNSDVFTQENGTQPFSSNPKIREAAFSNDVLNLQNNSDVIQISPDKAIVLRIKTHTPSAVLSLNEVENQIEKKLREAEIKKNATKLAIDLKKKLTEGMTLEAVAKQYKVSIASPGFMGRRANTVDTAILDAVFATPTPQSEQQPVYSYANTVKGLVIIAVTNVKEATVSDAAQQHKIFEEQVQNTQGLLEYDLYKQSMTDKAKISENF